MCIDVYSMYVSMCIVCMYVCKYVCMYMYMYMYKLEPPSPNSPYGALNIITKIFTYFIINLVGILHHMMEDRRGGL